MSNLFIVMSIATNIITNVALLNSTTMERVHKFEDMRYERLDSGCSSFVNEVLVKCHEIGITPACLGISTKGEVQEGTITLQRGSPPYPIKQILESQFGIPVAMLNRFQAFSFGVFWLLNKTGRDSLGVINLSNGAGCGVIKDGRLIQEYDSNIGMGGLQKIKRLSDGRLMTIAQIAGAEPLEKQAECLKISAKKLFEDGVNGRNGKSAALIRDTANAVALLVGNTSKRYGILDFCMNIYDKYGIGQEDKQRFVEIVKAEIAITSKAPVNFSYFAQEIREEDVKTFGAAKFAAIVSFPKEMKYIPFNNVYVVTGLPSSGKSTFMQKLFLHLGESGLKVGGIITEEVRGANHKRYGFVTTSYSSGFHPESCEIATLKANVSENQKSNYKPFKSTPYAINVCNIDQFIIPCLQKACMLEDVIIIDEIGGMQLFSYNFQREIFNICLNLQKPVIFTVPSKSNNQLVNQIKEKARITVVLEPGDREGSQQKGFAMLLPDLISSTIHTRLFN